MILTRALSQARSLVLGQLLPERCGVCASYGSLLCQDCMEALPVAVGPRCERCWQPFSTGECLHCAAYGSECTLIRACFIYTGGARRLVAALKYTGTFALAAPVHTLMADYWRATGLQAGVVVPVPLHPRRERQRGFNQSALLARGLAASLGLPCNETVLKRRRATPPQARATVEERRSNLYGAFESADDVLEGTRVLLVDDVTTTGATLGACASALFEGGAAAVYGFAFAR